MATKGSNGFFMRVSILSKLDRLVKGGTSAKGNRTSLFQHNLGFEVQFKFIDRGAFF